MSSVFTKIINGELPGRFIYRDERIAAFLTIEPIAYGHTLIVPVEEVDKWTDLDQEVWREMNDIAQQIGDGMIECFGSQRAGYLIAGFEVPHAHIHVFPANDMSGYSLSTTMAADETDDAKMDDAATKLRAYLGTQADGRMP
ncbi:HIT family protein [Corynebacterium cystitidis]|uniref:HIT family protein n=1 Tax=Corynebacterium cystitidis TaxID=35757 RepID=UPI00211DEABF|nr:HIT family protein [Corynebacterium cystitidis]